jgi:hypothetical protein
MEINMKKYVILALAGLALAGCQTTEQRGRQAVGTLFFHAIGAQAAVRACPDEVRLRNKALHSKIMASLNKSQASADFRNLGNFTRSTLEVNDRCDKLGENARNGRLTNIFLEAK